jgi:transposase
MSKRITKNYPLEFKQSSAKLAAESDQPISEIAEALGVHPTTLYGWVQRFHPKPKVNPPEKDPLNEELKRLRLKVARLEQQRDILKKAAAHEASEM